MRLFTIVFLILIFIDIVLVKSRDEHKLNKNAKIKRKVLFQGSKENRAESIIQKLLEKKKDLANMDEDPLLLNEIRSLNKKEKLMLEMQAKNWDWLPNWFTDQWHNIFGNKTNQN